MSSVVEQTRVGEIVKDIVRLLIGVEGTHSGLCYSDTTEQPR